MDSTFTPVARVGEFGLIERLRDTLGTGNRDEVLAGIGDDAAVYRAAPGNAHLITTDVLVEGVHFDRTFTPLGHLGYKALAVNVSDIVAMYAEPRYATVALGMPNNLSVEQAETLYAGLAQAARQYGVQVIGGDTSAAERLFLSISVVGEALEHEVVYRSGAQPGDVLCVTGDLGSSAAGLKVLLAEKDAFLDVDQQPDLAEWAYVVERHLAPLARMDRLHQWRKAGFRPKALIDISDGLASETHHICRASNVGAIVDAGLLPLHVQTFRVAERFGEQAQSYALYGGEDYELLFAADPQDLDALPDESYAIVGEVTEFAGDVTLALPDGDAVPLDASGFSHF